jgi:hypothetical protein
MEERIYTTRHSTQGLWNDNISYEERETKGRHAFEMYGHRFFVHSTGIPHRFTVSEESTGFNVGGGVTSRREEAIELAKQKLVEVGDMDFTAGINKAKEIVKKHFMK